jgi:DNA recombination protein Rad52
MSGFSAEQLRALGRKLDRRHVHSREAEGRSLDYIEGWFAIAQANAIFGFDGWDRQMILFERAFERIRNDRTQCAYVARVQIRVRAGETVIVREGTGWGSAFAPLPCDAHERALKAAETDATKRALATFGNRFGLGLYDKEQNGVTPRKERPPANRFSLYEPEGRVLAEHLSAEAFCSGFRQLLEKLSSSEQVESLLGLNKEAISRMRSDIPSLTTPKGVHYAEVLDQLARKHIEALHAAASQTAAVLSHEIPAQPELPDSATPPQSDARSPPPLAPSKIASGPRIDKSELAIATERRYRDKAYLKFVAAQPCLVCGRQPSHAHHLTFAQKRGLAIKVSDEFTVPLCAVHHDECHRWGDESAWWSRYGYDPLPVATALWSESRGVRNLQSEKVRSDEQKAPLPAH